jgi:hypothetical protein
MQKTVLFLSFMSISLLVEAQNTLADMNFGPYEEH